MKQLIVRAAGSALLLFCAALSPVGADTRYVDRSATGSNNGSSWANAWTSFSRIDWSQITAGDVLQISGGTYNENLAIGSSGSSGQPIRIIASQEAGHSGKVQINGRIYIDARRYVTVDGFSIYNASSHGGVFVQESAGITIRNCTINTPTYSSVQTDGIYAQRNTGNIYENNTIIISNGNTSPHCDAIQMYQERDPIIRGNWIEQRNNKTSNAQGIYATASYGSVTVYNNVCVNARGNNGIALRNVGGGSAVFYVYNNTVVTGGYWGIYLSECADPRIKNNIVLHSGSGKAIAVFNWAGTAANIDYNCVWTPSTSSPFYVNGSSNSWSQWRARGFDAHGLNQDPKLDAAGGYALTSGSSPINRAVSLAFVFTWDRLGAARPQGSAWDMGAYEYGATAVSTVPANPRNLRIAD